MQVDTDGAGCTPQIDGVDVFPKAVLPPPTLPLPPAVEAVTSEEVSHEPISGAIFPPPPVFPVGSNHIANDTSNGNVTDTPSTSDAVSNSIPLDSASNIPDALMCIKKASSFTAWQYPFTTKAPPSRDSLPLIKSLSPIPMKRLPSLRRAPGTITDFIMDCLTPKVNSKDDARKVLSKDQILNGKNIPKSHPYVTFMGVADYVFR